MMAMTTSSSTSVNARQRFDDGMLFIGKCFLSNEEVRERHSAILAEMYFVPQREIVGDSSLTSLFAQATAKVSIFSTDILLLVNSNLTERNT